MKQIAAFMIALSGLAAGLATAYSHQQTAAEFSMYNFVLALAQPAATPGRQCAAEAVARMIDREIGVGTPAWRLVQQEIEATRPDAQPEEIAESLLRRHGGLLFERAVTAAIIEECAPGQTSGEFL